jgi:hypothetical protein
MENRKIIFYPKSAMKPVILTDNSEEPIEKIQQDILEVLSDNKIGIFNTTNDSLIIRPSEIQAVLVSKKSNEHGPESDSKYSESISGADKSDGSNS